MQTIVDNDVFNKVVVNNLCIECKLILIVSQSKDECFKTL